VVLRDFAKVASAVRQEVMQMPTKIGVPLECTVTDVAISTKTTLVAEPSVCGESNVNAIQRFPDE
jgi:hypothetical protein